MPVSAVTPRAGKKPTSEYSVDVGLKIQKFSKNGPASIRSSELERGLAR
jgi:hypothetical protein